MANHIKPCPKVFHSIRLVGLWRLPYKQKQPWFESKIEYYRDLVQLVEWQSPKLFVGSSNLSVPANKNLFHCGGIGRRAALLMRISARSMRANGAMGVLR